MGLNCERLCYPLKDNQISYLDMPTYIYFLDLLHVNKIQCKGCTMKEQWFLDKVSRKKIIKFLTRQKVFFFFLNFETNYLFFFGQFSSVLRLRKFSSLIFPEKLGQEEELSGKCRQKIYVTQNIFIRIVKSSRYEFLYKALPLFEITIEV